MSKVTKAVPKKEEVNPNRRYVIAVLKSDAVRLAKLQAALWAEGMEQDDPHRPSMGEVVALILDEYLAKRANKAVGKVSVKPKSKPTTKPETTEPNPEGA